MKDSLIPLIYRENPTLATEFVLGMICISQDLYPKVAFNAVRKALNQRNAVRILQPQIEEDTLDIIEKLLATPNETIFTDEEEQQINTLTKTLMLNFSPDKSFAELLQQAHKQIFSYKDGLKYEPGKFKSSKLKNQLNDAFDHFAANSKHLYGILDLKEEVDSIQPFISGNEILSPLVVHIAILKMYRIEPMLPIDAIDVEGGDYESFVKVISEASQTVIDILEETRLFTERYNEASERLDDPRRRKLIEELLPILLEQPIFTVKQIEQVYKKSTFQTLNSAIEDLQERGFVKSLKNQSRNRVFYLPEYRKIIKKQYEQF